MSQIDCVDQIVSLQTEIFLTFIINKEGLTQSKNN